MEIVNWTVPDELRPGIENLVAGKDADEVVQLLYRENYKLRESRRNDQSKSEERIQALISNHETTLAELKEAQETALEELQGKLAEFDGVNLDEIQAQKTELETLRSRIQLQQIAEAMAWETGVFLGLNQLAGGLEYETSGETIKVKQVNPGEDTTEIDLAEYAQENWSDFMPALRKQEDNRRGNRGLLPTSPPPNATTSPDKSEAELFREKLRRDRTPGPLDDFKKEL